MFRKANLVSGHTREDGRKTNKGGSWQRDLGRGEMGVGQGSKENGKEDGSWRLFFFLKHRIFVIRDKNDKSL